MGLNGSVNAALSIRRFRVRDSNRPFRQYGRLSCPLWRDCKSLARLTTQPKLRLRPRPATRRQIFIFCTLFSLPITDWVAAQVFQQFDIYQCSQPLLNAFTFLILPNWMSSFFRRDTRRAAQSIWQLITQLTDSR